MKNKECKICGKIIEGFTDKDLKHRMIMHSMKHRKEEEKQNATINGT